MSSTTSRRPKRQNSRQLLAVLGVLAFVAALGMWIVLGHGPRETGESGPDPSQVSSAEARVKAKKSRPAAGKNSVLPRATGESRVVTPADTESEPRRDESRTGQRATALKPESATASVGLVNCQIQTPEPGFVI
ncbi:MAG: hypothetical protein EHM42_08640, partial [Planctomycetaceae bacterium]